MRFGKHHPCGTPRHDSVRGARGQLSSTGEDKRESTEIRERDWKEFAWRQ